MLAQEEPLAKAKALYDSVAHEEALTVLAAIEAPEAQQTELSHAGAGPDAGREERGGTARLDRASVRTVVGRSTPRFVALVSEAKKRLLPGIARKTFNEARISFAAAIARRQWRNSMWSSV